MLFHLLITEITAVIGAITGSVSLGLVVYKTVKDKPNLMFELADQYYFSAGEHDNFHSLSIQIKIHNKGGRNTTIYGSNLSVRNNDKDYNLISNVTPFTVPQDSTTIQYFLFHLDKKDGLIEKDPTNSTIVIKHTYGEKTIQIKTIRKIK